MRRLLSIAVLACLALASAARGAERLPNIIWIMADDLGYAEIGSFGQQKIMTPTVDRLAKEGIRFTQFYCGSAVCAPTRSCLMTGQHTGHTRVRANKDPQGGRVPLLPEDVTVAEVLKTVGYTTGMVGKWGLGEPETTGLPTRQGFDFWFGYLNQAHAHTYYPDYLWRNEEKVPLPGNMSGGRGQYSHDLMTEEALGFINRSRDKPFFLYVPYTIPHATFEVPDLGPYADRDWSKQDKTIAAMVTRMDRDIDRMLKLLDDLGLTEQTLVFFTSDNGGPQRGKGPDFFESNKPLRGYKSDLYEGGIRAPLIARWKGRIEPGQVSDHVWAMWDVLPTLAELTGAKAPKNIDGLSMLALLTGGKAPEHDHLYWEFHEGAGFAQAVRIGDYKAIRNVRKPIELYDLSKDVGEKHDIAAEHPDVVARAVKIMREDRVDSPVWKVKK